MEMEKKLYPMKFCPIRDEHSWGTEDFVLADLGYKDCFVKEGWLASNTISELMDTYIDRVVGERVYDFYGRQFPVCIKKLSVKDRTPLVVHPSDEIAEDRYDFLGKEKLWYVLNAGTDARIGIGFKKDTDAAELCAACEEGSVEAMINMIAPYKSQSLFIPSGTPHFAQGNLEILEISQSSPMDFCLYNWGQTLGEEEYEPEFDLIAALDFINYSRIKLKASRPDGVSELLADEDQFKIHKISLNSAIKVSSEQYDNFALYCCTAGSAKIQTKLGSQELGFSVACGETILVPAECGEYVLVPIEAGTELIEVLVERQTQDKYIDPSVPAELPEE